MPVRNEDWVIGLTAQAALMWVDELMVLNHASTDGTANILTEIAREHPSRVAILSEPNPVWGEMAHRQRLLDAARMRGATHIALLDADEILASNLVGAIRPEIERVPAGHRLELSMFCMWRNLDCYRHDASVWSNARTTLAFGDTPSLCWRSAGGYEHHHREPYGSLAWARLPRERGGVMHLQFADRRRLVAKHALYKMAEVIRWPGRRPVIATEAEYNLAINEDGLRTLPAPTEWWEGYRALMGHLHLGAEPWQEAECQKLWQEHGAAKFAGLNLFGVV